VGFATSVFKGFLWVECEEVFTTEAQSGSAATEIREISRKGAKFGENMVKIVYKIIYLPLPNLACFATWRE